MTRTKAFPPEIRGYSRPIRYCWTLCALLLLGFAAIAAAPRAWAAKGELQIYFVDVEGGQSTLFVTPTGESLLIDTGWPDHEDRDAQRIAAAAKRAGVKKINYVLLTHYHMDHTGGVPQLAARIPVGTFIDHGPNHQTRGNTEMVWEAYQKVLATGKYKHIVPKPGDVLPVSGMKVTVVSSNGNVIDHPFPGAGQPNEYCKIPVNKARDKSENAYSLGVLIHYGKLRILDLGDLTWDKELELMCPVNRLGRIGLLVVSHHGSIPSSTPELVDAIHPRVAVMDNGATKGGTVEVLDTVSKAPGLETLWQLHFSEAGGAAHNTAAAYIANLQGPDTGNYLEVTAKPDGGFKVFNSRTNAITSYPAR